MLFSLGWQFYRFTLYNEYCYIMSSHHHHLWCLRRNPNGIAANKLDCDIEVSSNSSHIITFTFRLIPFGKGMPGRSSKKLLLILFILRGFKYFFILAADLGQVIYLFIYLFVCYATLGISPFFTNFSYQPLKKKNLWTEYLQYIIGQMNV